MWQLSFRDDIKVTESSPDSSLLLEGHQFQWATKKLSPGMRAALTLLAEGPVSEDRLLEHVAELDGPNGCIYFYQYLPRLSRILCYTLLWDGQPLATLVPFAPPSNYQFQAQLGGTERAYVLSRFAYTRKDETGCLVVESPLGRAKVVLHQPVTGALLAALAQPQTPAQLTTAAPGLPEKISAAFATLLLNAQVIAPVDAAGQPSEAADPRLAQWEFPDLLFHKHARIGWKETPHGGTYRFEGRFEPLPALKPNLPDAVIPLHKPDLQKLAQTEPSLTAVLEQRRSVRDYGEDPITLEQLGEFLYRVAAVRKRISDESNGWVYTQRPYPAGGSLYELEIYPVVNTCQGLPAGLYYYNPFAHQLHSVSERTPYVHALLNAAWTTADRRSQPQVLLGLTARFQMLQWKYESVAYALIMKHVGVLQQTMYLVATAMGLAPCALGAGNAELFAQAANLDYYAETSVGEFLLGSQRRA